MNVTTADLQGMIAAISARITENVDELNRLDGALGDGDHGTGISAGFAAAVEAIQEATSPADVLTVTAKTLMNRMGGSSGALYGTLFLRGAMQIKDQDTLSPDVFAAMWGAGTEGVQQRGKAEPGDKTMVDALIPAVEALQRSVDDGQSFIEALSAAAEAAEQGAQATAQMQAKHGRAKYVGERAIGHVDAGARSLALMFQAMGEYLREYFGENVEGQQNGET